MRQATYKILVVDDEPDVEPLIMQRMRRDIRARKYEFVFALNGVEAVNLLNRDEEIDMVISDINMPQMDGLTLLGQISEINPQHTLNYHFRVWGHEEYPHSNESRRIRLCHQTSGFRRPARHD